MVISTDITLRRVEIIQDSLEVGVGTCCRVRLRAYQPSDGSRCCTQPVNTYIKRERVHTRDVHGLNLLYETLHASNERQLNSLWKHATYALSVEETHKARSYSAEQRCDTVVEPFDVARLPSVARRAVKRGRDLRRVRDQRNDACAALKPTHKDGRPRKLYKSESK